jgi:glycosyltransferase involved in cell wall biosynthesis
MQDGILRLVYWGRCNPDKGLHLVIDAIRALPASIPIQFDCYGPYWDGDYGQQLQTKIAGDLRFRVQGNLPKDKLLPRLQAYDLAVVPSTWLETGPLTVLEAFAAGLPVAGSDLGGIKELLTGKAGGYLLPTDWQAWASFFQDVIEQRLLLTPLSIEFRSFVNVANDLNLAYQQLTILKK